MINNELTPLRHAKKHSKTHALSTPLSYSQKKNLHYHVYHFRKKGILNRIKTTFPTPPYALAWIFPSPLIPPLQGPLREARASPPHALKYLPGAHQKRDKRRLRYHLLCQHKMSFPAQVSGSVIIKT